MEITLFRFICPLLFCCVAACSSSGPGSMADGGNDPGAGLGWLEGGAARADGEPHSSGIDDGETPATCSPDLADLVGCPCTPGTVRACWTGQASTRGVGACTDGVQTCPGSNTSEHAIYEACTGAVLPSQESCTNGVDDDCNGLLDCADPACAIDPACSGACAEGEARPCYNGPPGTGNVGTCRQGTQICTGGQWPASCPGEILPAAEVCSDALDHNCNGLPGCADASCSGSPACCTPASTCSGGQNCGTQPDGCGGTISCGSCVSPDTCGGGGVPNQCGTAEVPVTCGAWQPCCVTAGGSGLWPSNYSDTVASAAACRAFCDSFPDTICCRWQQSCPSIVSTHHCWAYNDPACKDPYSPASGGWLCSYNAHEWGCNPSVGDPDSCNVVDSGFICQ